MANELLITDIVGQEAFQQIEKLSKALVGLRKDMKDAMKDGKVAVKEMLKGLSFNPTDLDGLYKKNAAYNEQQKKLIEVENRLKETQKQYNDILKKVNTQVKEAVKQAKEKADLDLRMARAAQAQEKEEQAKYQTLIKEIQAERALDNATRSRTVTEAQITEALNTQARSIKEAQVQNRVLRQAVRELDQTTATAAKSMESYNKKIEENEKFIDQSVDSMTARKRNIGNYASAFDGLGMSVQQIVRELPSAAIGLNTFFLAISNNLPILADEIARARQELKLMNEQGLKGTPVWKQLVSSLFSWQTAMVAGITILSMYGKDIFEWISNLTMGKEELLSTAKAVESVNKALKEGEADYSKNAVNLKSLSKEWESLTSIAEKTEWIKKNKDKFDSLGVSVTNVTEADNVFVENTEAVIKAMKLRAQASAAMALAEDKYREIADKRVQAELKREQASKIEKSGGSTVAYSSSVTGAVSTQSGTSEYILRKQAEALDEEADRIEENVDVYIGLANAKDKEAEATLRNAGIREKSNKELEQEAEDYAKYMLDIEKQITDATINAITDRKEREIAEINAEYDEKEAAIKGNSEKETQLRALLTEERARKIKEKETEYERDIRETNLNNMMAYEKEGSDAMMAYRIELLELQQEKEVEEAEKTGASVLEVEKKYAALIQQEREKRTASKAGDFEVSLSANSIIDGMAMNEQLRQLSEAYAQGKIGKEEYEAESYRIQQEYAEKSLRLAITTIKSILSLENLSDEDRLKYAQQLAQAQMDLDNMVTDNKIANDEEQMRKEKEKRQKQMELMQQVSSLLGSLGEFGDQLFQNRIDQLDEENEANQEAYDKEVENIEKLEESGAISTEEAEARKRAAEDKTKAKEEEIAKKKAELQRKQAIYDKAMSIAQVGISTALGIMSTIAQLGLPAAAPFVALVAAMGAVQLATILATPIPKYKEGTDYHKGGLAIVGDGGVPETVLTPDGKLYLTPACPTLTELPIGTKVFPENIFEDEDKYVRSDALTLMDMRDGDGMPIVMVQNDYSGLERRIDKLERSMLKAFEKAEKESKKARYEAFKSRI